MDQLKRNSLFKGDNVGLVSHRRSMWRQRMWVERLGISKLLHEIINAYIDTTLVEVVLK